MGTNLSINQMNNKFYSGKLFDLSSYRLERAVLDAAWDRIVAASPQGSVFATCAYLKAAGGHPSPWYCLKNDELRAAVLVHESADGTRAVLEDLVVYAGIMFAKADPKQNHAQIMSEEFRVTSAVVEGLAEAYKAVEFQAHPDFIDIRPFQWHNYGSDGPKFEVGVRFTSILKLVPSQSLEDNPMYSAANASRRQEIRYGIKAGVTVEEECDLNLFSDLTVDTFRHQGLDVPDDELGRKQTILASLHAAGKVRMFIARTVDGIPISVAAMGLDGRRAYYLFGANDSAQRNNFGGTMVIWHALNALAQAGVTELDMEGVNSPRRGYFKLSFGGTLRPYYHLTLAD